MSAGEPQVDRRQFMQLTAGVTAAAAGAGNATAQNESDSDDSTDSEQEFEPPSSFIGSEVQAIGADRMLMEALNDPDDGKFKSMGGFMDFLGPRLDDLAEESAELQADAVLKIDTMDNRDEHVLVPMFNALEQGRNAAWLNGLVAFLEAVEDTKSESETVDDAIAAVEDYYAIPMENLLNFWKEQMNELEALWSAIDESLSNPSDNLYWFGSELSTEKSEDSGASLEETAPEFGETSIELPDGESITITTLEGSTTASYNDTSREPSNQSGSVSWSIDPTVTPDLNFYDFAVSGIEAGRLRIIAEADSGPTSFWAAYSPDDPTTLQEFNDSDLDFTGIQMNDLNKYQVIWDGLQAELDQMTDEIEAFATNAYDDLAAGELSIEEIVANNPMLMSSEFSTEYSSTGHYSYAAASMASMGMSHSLEHAMRIELHDGTELEGTLFVTDGEFEVEVGETITPDSDYPDATVYFAFEAGSATRQLHGDEYETTIDGGVITLTVTPKGGTQYRINTVAGETVEIDAEQWVPVDESNHIDPDVDADYTVDLSDELENPITDVESIEHHYPEGTGDSIISVRNEFTILEAYNRDSGEPVDVVEGQESQDLETTEVQFAEEDLEAFKEMMEELNSNSNAGGSGGGGWSWNGMDWSFLPDVPTGDDALWKRIATVAAAGVGVGGGAWLLTNLGGDDDRARR